MNRRIFFVICFLWMFLGVFSNAQGQTAVRRVNTTCGIASTKKAYDMYFNALKQKDEQTLVALVLAGHLVIIEQGTRVKILDFGFMKSKILVLEGNHEGFIGYVATDFLAKQ